ncbi:solute carrier family 22 member 7 [Bufo bufo]|uniref:solute carrier family 22 member 7 n=1 Tax=Bufo bufo TaxID=8384 RepID=UPI001ABE9FA6|nr:solute carrier family 22 member 7 [Bufo bufo]
MHMASSSNSMEVLPLATASPPVLLSFEELLNEAGGFGKFQLRIILILSLVRIIVPLHFLQHNFISAVPPHHCTIPNHRRPDNRSHEDLLLINLPQNPDGSFSSCEMFSKPLQNTSQGEDHSTVHSCDQGWEYDRSMFSSTTVTQWDLVCERKGLSHLLATFFFIGVMLGSVVFGYLSDRFGRRSMLLLSWVLSLVFGGLSAASVSYPMAVICLTLSGLSLCGMHGIVIVLCFEWVDLQHRTAAGIFTSIGWSIGTALLALITYLVRDWRWLMVSITAPCLLGIASVWWLSESPRWLLSKGFIERGEKELMQCAAMNGKKLNSFTENKENIQKLVDSLGSSSTNYSYFDLFRTPRLRRISLCAGLSWIGLAFSYYGINLNISGFGLSIYLTQFLYALVEVPARVGGYLLLNYLGNRRTEVFTVLMTGACLGANVFIPADKGPLRTTFAVLGKGFAEASFCVIYMHTCELYPTVIRQSGIGYTAFLARFGVILATLLKLLDNIWPPLSQLVICITMVVCGLIVNLLPETHNTRLPDFISDVEDSKSAAGRSDETRA